MADAQARQREGMEGEYEQVMSATVGRCCSGRRPHVKQGALGGEKAREWQRGSGRKVVMELGFRVVRSSRIGAAGGLALALTAYY